MSVSKTVFVAAVLLVSGFAYATPAKAWTCAEARYTCAHGNVGNKGENSTQWTWTCSDQWGSVSCSEDKPKDVCPNIDGAQATVPAGKVIEDGKCVTPPQDVCSNIDGVQTTVPDGKVEEDGKCVTPPKDVCDNITGVQTSVPDGQVIEDGKCVDPPADVCQNIDGVQATVPEGMVSEDGQCTTPPVTIVKEDDDDDDDDDKDKKKKKHKKKHIEEKRIPATGLPLAALAGLTLMTTGLYAATRRMKRA